MHTTTDRGMPAETDDNGVICSDMRHDAARCRAASVTMDDGSSQASEGSRTWKIPYKDIHITAKD